MNQYRTAEEKAAEWNVTPNHVQYLCRTGRIEGAIKRANVWFIPNDTPTPTKNTKAGVKSFRFVGTKKKIFDTAIELFMRRGFNDVSLKEIASSIGIRQSTIYNHFSSKQEILKSIYDYFCHYFVKDRPSIGDIESVLRHGSFMDIMERLQYEFNEECRQKMSDITKIIFQRISIDERAREISRTLLVEEGIRYAEQVFNKAIEFERFTTFDAHAMSVFINSLRMFSLYVWIVDPSPETTKKLQGDILTLCRQAAQAIAGADGVAGG